MAGLSACANVASVGSFILNLNGVKNSGPVSTFLSRDAAMRGVAQDIETTIHVLKLLKESVEAVGTDTDKQLYRSLVKLSQENHAQLQELDVRIQQKSKFKIYSCWGLVQRLRLQVEKNLKLAQTTSSRIRLEHLNKESKKIQVDAGVISLTESTDLCMYAIGHVDDRLGGAAYAASTSSSGSSETAAVLSKGKQKDTIYGVENFNIEELEITTFLHNPFEGGPSSR